MKMTSEKLIDDIHCTGCFACKSSCPVNCITVELDAEGFVIPSVDAEKCIGCNKCTNVCPARNPLSKSYPTQSYAAYTQDKELYDRSSSGGVFAHIAKKAIDNGGYVCGAAMEPKSLKVKHIVISRAEDISKLQGSKYVQSDTSEIVDEIKDILKQGNSLLFSGTPCQVAAVKKCIEPALQENLWTIDLVCHGVSNHGFFKRSIGQFEKCNTKIQQVYFRVKSKFDKSICAYKIQYEDGSTEVIPNFKDLYYHMYVTGNSYRDSCYHCQFACPERMGDITLGDCASFKLCTELDQSKVFSTVLLNTPKGKALWENCKEGLVFEVQDTVREIASSSQLSHPVRRSQTRQELFKKLETMPIVQLQKAEINVGVKSKLAYMVKRSIPISVRQVFLRIYRKIRS